MYSNNHSTDKKYLANVISGGAIFSLKSPNSCRFNELLRRLHLFPYPKICILFRFDFELIEKPLMILVTPRVKIYLRKMDKTVEWVIFSWLYLDWNFFYRSLECSFVFDMISKLNEFLISNLNQYRPSKLIATRIWCRIMSQCSLLFNRFWYQFFFQNESNPVESYLS